MIKVIFSKNDIKNTKILNPRDFTNQDIEMYPVLDCVSNDCNDWGVHDWIQDLCEYLNINKDEILKIYVV